MTARRVHFNLVFGDGDERWSAPDPTHEKMRDARHAARYPLSPYQPNYNCASQAETYEYLVNTCPTTELAVAKLRMIRRAIRELPRNEREER